MQLQEKAAVQKQAAAHRLWHFSIWRMLFLWCDVARSNRTLFLLELRERLIIFRASSVPTIIWWERKHCLNFISSAGQYHDWE